MRRRDFITLIGSATALPFVARAQQKSMPVIGYLSVGSPQLQHPFVVAFHEGLKEAGFVAGENLTIEYRWAEERYERLPRLAADLVGRKVEVIVATGELPLRVAASATSTIPIVFTIGSDPVQSGLVASLARPDRNITGFTAIATELISKRFELMLLAGAVEQCCPVIHQSPGRTQHLTGWADVEIVFQIVGEVFAGERPIVSFR